jgi:hypothetical protein
MKLFETDLREMLEREAREFEMPAGPSDRTLRRARRRRTRNVLLAGAPAVAAVVFAVLAVTLQAGSPQSFAPKRSAGSVPRAHLRLVDYAVRADPTSDQSHSGTGPTITLDDVLAHQRCMRAQGFDLPEPTRQPGGGWAVIVDAPTARGLDFRSRSFREAWFVTCGGLGGPLTGDLVVGGPRSQIDRFTACMADHGFDLPEPTKDTSGHYDTDEWQFDLTSTDIDTSTQAWNRAMFVLCAPAQI